MGRRRYALELFIQLPKHGLLRLSTGPVPELHADHVAKYCGPIGHNAMDGGSNLAVAIFS